MPCEIVIVLADVLLSGTLYRVCVAEATYLVVTSFWKKEFYFYLSMYNIKHISNKNITNICLISGVDRQIL